MPRLPVHVILPVLLAAVVIAGGGFAIWWYLRKRQFKQRKVDESVYAATSSTPPLLTPPAPRIPHREILPSTTEESITLVSELQDDNLRDLVEERLADIAFSEKEDIERWALALVDLLDELRLMQSSYSPQDAETVSRLKLELIRLLREQECELIDLDEWTPSQQRATRIEHNQAGDAAPRILSKGASGLVVKGLLIRKQEVTLNCHQNH